MNICRDSYIEKLTAKSWNGKVKIITGIRRCGKSYLLSVLYKQYLMERGAKPDQFIEIDFVVNMGNERVYVQSALHVDTPEKKAQETFSLKHTNDSFRKIVILDGNQRPWTDEDGVVYMGVIPFLLGQRIS